MTFEEWWETQMEMVFTSTDALDDAYEAARQAWDAGYDEGHKDGLEDYQPVV